MGAQKPGFFTNTSLPPADSVKNPVSFGFFYEYFVTARRFGKHIRLRERAFVGVRPGMNRLSGLFHNR